MPPIKPINDTTYEVGLRGGDKVEIGDRKAVDNYGRCYGNYL